VVIPSKGRSLGLEAYGHAVVFIRRPSSVRDYCTPRSPGRVSQERECSVHTKSDGSRSCDPPATSNGGANGPATRSRARNGSYTNCAMITSP